MSPTRTDSKSRRSSKLARYFFPATAVLLVVLGVVGFSSFYFRGMAYPNREITPPIRTLVIAHGLSMSGWLALILVQPFLIMGRKHRLHMSIGRGGALLAALILILGLWVGIRSAAVTPADAIIWNLPPKQFMAVPVISVLVFATFVGLGVWYRRRPEIHRAMMVLATLSALPAAVSRIDALNNLYVGGIWERLFGPFFMTMLLGVLLLAARCVITRSFDRYFAIGMAVLIVISMGIMRLAPTPAWDQFASLLVR